VIDPNDFGSLAGVDFVATMRTFGCYFRIDPVTSALTVHSTERGPGVWYNWLIIYGDLGTYSFPATVTTTG
jgi:hypothetical protein